MSTKNVNLLWKSFKGIRKLNSINSDTELGADNILNVRLSKEKSGRARSIKSSGWFNPYAAIGTATISQTVGSGLSNIAVDKVTFGDKTKLVGTNTTTFTCHVYTTTENEQEVIHRDWHDADGAEVILRDYGIIYSGDPEDGDTLSVASYFEPIIRLFSANLSGYGPSNQLVAFTKSMTDINAWIVEDDTGLLDEPIQIAQFPLEEDVYDCCMIQWGDRLSIVVTFGQNTLGFITYAGTDLSAGYGWTKMSGNWYYRIESISEATTEHEVMQIRSIRPYNSRLAINGYTTYKETRQEGDQEIKTLETIYGVWFSEAGQPLNFTADLLTSATDTSAFFVETGEYVNKLVEYSGLVAFCKTRSYNIHGTTQNNITCVPLTAKGVIGNAAFVLNGECAYVDDYAHNAFVLKGNIDNTIGFDGPIGDEIQDYLTDVENVTINAVGRRVRMLKETGQSLVYDVDIGEWTVETFVKNARCVTFLDKEIFCDGTGVIKQITDSRQLNSRQTPLEGQYYSYYKTNLIWLDSQSSIKSHIYPLAVILEPQTNNDFYVRFTTDRREVYLARVTRAGYKNIATYSNDDKPSEAGSFFVESDDDFSGGIFFGTTGNDLLITIDRPPFWRYLQIEIYTNSPNMEFNIAGIEAKNTFITDEFLDY